MKVLIDNNGELLVKVPSSNWYNYVGTHKYVPGIVAKGFDTVAVRRTDLKKMVKSCIDYNSCTDKYWRDQSGELLRYNHSLYKAIDMRRQSEIKMVGYKYDPLSLYVGLYIPFTDGRWRLITSITNNMVELDGEKLRDKPYIISEMIGYMNACLPNKNGVDSYHWSRLPITDDVFKKTYTELPVIPEAVSEYIKDSDNLDLLVALTIASKGYKNPELWIAMHQNVFSSAWLDGMWRVEETGEIVKLEA